MPYSWPKKLIREFTDDEITAALRAAERGEDMNPAIVQSCWREWERRRGLPASH